MPSRFIHLKNLKISKIVIQKGMRWKVGTGNNVKFWNNNWLGEEPLSSSSNFRLFVGE